MCYVRHTVAIIHRPAVNIVATRLFVVAETRPLRGRNRMIRAFLAITAVIGLGACQTVQHQTASGRPEVEIGRPASEVKAAFAGLLLNKGYSITRDTDLQLIAEKTIDNPAAVLLLGTGMGPPRARVTTTLLSAGGATRVVSDISMVQNAGTAFERVTPMTDSPAAGELQNALAQVQESMSAPQSKPVVARSRRAT
jgi:hypothetical protein